MEANRRPSAWEQVLEGLPDPLTEIVPDTLGAMFETVVRRFPEHRYLTYRNVALTYDETHRLAAALAADLIQRGVGRGDRVGLCLPSHPAYVVAVHALWRIGAVGVGMNPLYAGPMLRHFARDAGVKVILTTDSPDSLTKVEAVAAAVGALLKVFRHDAEDLGAAAAEAVETAPPAEIDPGADLAMLQYTGGTTGEPKAVMLTHANLCSACVQQRTAFPSMRPGREVALIAMPFGHIGGLLAGLIYVTSMGGELVVMDRFAAPEALSLIARRGVTYIPGAPTLWVALMAAPEASDTDWSSLRHVLSGAAPTPVELKLAFQALTGAEVRSAYGSTETAPGVAMESAGEAPNTSTGPPYPLTRVTIRDPADPTLTLPVGEVGEICVAGPQVMAGYWRKPEATAQVFVDDSFRTGDLGYLGRDGKLYLVDRLKDVINVSGYKVYPRLIEEAVYGHSAIKEAVCVGVPDPYRGETVKLYATLRDGRTLTLPDLQAFLADKLSPMEIPKRLEIRADLPKTAVGKLSRQALRLEASEARAEIPLPAPPTNTPPDRPPGRENQSG